MATIAHRSELKLQRAFGSCGHNSSVLFSPSFLAYWIRLTSSHLLHPLANPITARAASPVVSRAAILPWTWNTVLLSLRAATEGTPRRARSRGTRRWRSRRWRPHRQQVSFARVHPSLCATNSVGLGSRLSVSESRRGCAAPGAASRDLLI